MSARYLPGGIVFRLTDSDGVPLEIVLAALAERNLVPTWVDYIEAALAAGHGKDNLRARITGACADVFGAEHAAAVGLRFDLYVARQEEVSAARTIAR